MTTECEFSFEKEYRRQKNYIEKILKYSEGCSVGYKVWSALMPALSFLRGHDDILYENCMIYLEESIKNVDL